MEGFLLSSFDDSKLHVYEYNEVKKPKGIVQIIHGMAEHAGRYQEFCEFLNKQGFIVFASDHRSHGRTASDIKKIGKYENDIFYDTIKDQIFFSEYLIEKYNLPLIVLGHSFGSFIAERYAELYHKHSALILSGSSYLKNDISILFGLAVANLSVLIKGPNGPANLIHNLSFNRYKKQFMDKNWLTSDKEMQKKLKVDRYMGRVFSVNFYKYFFKGITHIYAKKNIANMDVKTPVLLISGKKDILSKHGALVTKLKEYYLKVGINKVDIKLYDDARHEVLNEKNRKDVYKDVVNFIERTVKFKEN